MPTRDRDSDFMPGGGGGSFLPLNLHRRVGRGWRVLNTPRWLPRKGVIYSVAKEICTSQVPLSTRCHDFLLLREIATLPRCGQKLWTA